MSVGDRFTNPAEGRGEKGRRGLKLGLAWRRLKSFRVEIERAFWISLLEGCLGSPDQACTVIREVMGRSAAQKAHGFLVLKALWVETKDTLKSIQGLVGPTASEVCNAEVIESILELWRQLRGASESLDSAPALTELEPAETQEVQALGCLFEPQALLQMGDRVTVLTTHDLEGAQSEMWEKCVGSHFASTGEGVFGLVPSAEIRSHSTEIHERFKLGAAQFHDLSESDTGGFEFVGMK
jgi:hypothetical protein